MPLKSFRISRGVLAAFLYFSGLFSVTPAWGFLTHHRSPIEAEADSIVASPVASPIPAKEPSRGPASNDSLRLSLSESSANTISTPVESQGFFSRTGEELTSAFSAPASYYLYGGLASGLLYTFAREEVVDKVQRTVVNNQVLGKKAGAITLFGEVIPNVTYTFAQLGYGYLANDSRSYLRSEMMFKATLYTSVAVSVLKYTFREPRPDGGLALSFPSGHTATAFSFATIVALEHGWVWGSLSYAAASVAGYARINDNRHYVHDVLAGAGIGTAFGIGIHHLLSKRFVSSKKNFSMKYLPVKNGGMALLEIEY